MSLSLTLTSSPAQLAFSQFGGGRGSSVKLLTAGGFRLYALNLLIPGKFDALVSAFSFVGVSQ